MHPQDSSYRPCRRRGKMTSWWSGDADAVRRHRILKVFLAFFLCLLDIFMYIEFPFLIVFLHHTIFMPHLGIEKCFQFSFYMTTHFPAYRCVDYGSVFFKFVFQLRLNIKMLEEKIGNHRQMKTLSNFLSWRLEDKMTFPFLVHCKPLLLLKFICWLMMQFSIC